MDKNQNTEREQEYTQPQIRDYGEVTELTAGLSHGNRADATFKIGQPVSFLSGP
jgi:hypothetical protein